MKHDFKLRQVAPLKTIPDTGGCMCIECQKSALYSQQRANRMQPFTEVENRLSSSNHFLTHHSFTDSVDSLSGTADKFIGGTLLSNSFNVNVYSSPTGKLLRTVPANQIIGVIASYIKDENGNVWWQLTDNGFVKHTEGRFNTEYLTQTLANEQAKTDAKIKVKVDERLKANAANNALYAFGKQPLETITDALGSLKWYLIGLVVLVAAVMIFKR